MDTSTHTFPIPELETHKLDEIRNDLPGKKDAYVANNAWMLLAVSALGGCLVGLLWPQKRLLRS